MKRSLQIFSVSLAFMGIEAFGACPKSASTFYPQRPDFKGENLVAVCAELSRPNPRNTIYHAEVDVCVYVGTNTIRKLPFFMTYDLIPGQHFGTSFENNKFRPKAYQVVNGKHVGTHSLEEGDWGSYEEDREDIIFDPSKLTLSAQKFDNVSPTPRIFTVWKKNDDAVVYRCKSALLR